MVACAALATHPLVSLVAPMTTSAGTVDQLKQQLLLAVDNENETDALSVVLELEKMSLTKELLESTRVGATVNDVRRKASEKWPVLSKRCRALIKAWQKLIEDRPASSCASSANGTPNLVGRRLTPCTPVNKRVTSTGVTDTRQTLSPSGGSYAPRSIHSPAGTPQIQSVIHKSQSVGAELTRKVEETPRNGKRKADEAAAPGQTGSAAGLKRTKTVSSQLASPAPRTDSVLAARRNAVQSTADLISQLSSNLPDHMSIDYSLRQHEEKIKREQADEELALTLSGNNSGSPYIAGERKKRKYERKIQRTPVTPSESKLEDGPRGGLILRLPRTTTASEDLPSVGKETSPPPTLHRQEPVSESSSTYGTPGPSRPQSSRSAVDWLAMLPSLDILRKKAAAERKVQPSTDPTRSYIMKVHDRQILALPYLADVDPRPDFIVHKYPNQLQYYAEENFLYGSERPSE